MTNGSKPSRPWPLFSRMVDEEYEQVVFCHDAASGLKSIIAVHSTRLGPALGGSRFFAYPTDDDALYDVLNLSQAMTYKASLAGLPLGGGKAVIVGDPTREKSPALLQAFGGFLNRLNGAYVTTEDSGTSPADMDEVRKATKFVVGGSPEKGGFGDPSPFTAKGVVEGMKACLKHLDGSTDLKGRRIAIQGIGHVGYPLAALLNEAKARLVVSDTNPAHLKRATAELGAEVVDPEKIYDVECDIFAPCALGGALTLETTDRLRCKIVAGAANNQLASNAVSERLEARKIAYAPDFAINAGGLIHVGSEWLGRDMSFIEGKIRDIFDTIDRIFRLAKSGNERTADVAVRLAKERVRAGL